MANRRNISALIPFDWGDTNELKDCRNRALTARFYYHFHIVRKRPDDIYILLSKTEFFIKPETIYKILTADAQNDYLNQLIETNATAARLQRDYPGFKWQ